MSEQPFQRLAWQNRWVRYIQQPLSEAADCFQESVLLNPENNLIVLNLSEFEFTRLFSAIMTGAEISYPDESHQVMVDFLKGIQCPPTLVSEECYNLPTYANNILYSPANPYIEPDEIPDGYLTQPFLINGQNGNDFPGYEPFDAVVPFGAITFDVNFFEDIAGQLPTIQIMVNGSGSVNLRFLSFVQGGLVVVTLDTPPNLLDILAGIVTGAENIVDLNQDLVSLPPETAKELIFPVTIETAGIHTIYAVFLPILDDSLIPLRFGGGFRGLELCGFLPEGDMGLQNLRFIDCNLEQQNSDGSWTVVSGWEDWLDCVPTGGGGGGASNLLATAYPLNVGTNKTTTSATFVNSTLAINHTYTKSKALVIVDNVQVGNSGSGTGYIQIRQDDAAPSGAGSSEGIGFNTGGERREVQSAAVFVGITAGSHEIELYFRSSATTAEIYATGGIVITIIEFDDASELNFVEDVRIVGRELQKKIAGAWITVSDSLATILNAIEAIANNAASAASAAQSTANNALTVASGAVTVNNTQNTRLTNLENDVEQIVDIDIPQINLTLADHETRIDALEAAVGGESPYFDGGVWSHTFDWTLGSQLGWTGVDMTYVNGFGWNLSNVGADGFLNLPTVDIIDSRITHIKLELFRQTSGTGTLLVEFPLGASTEQIFELTGGGTLDMRWYKVPNFPSIYTPRFKFMPPNSTGHQIKRALFIGRGDNPFL